MLGKRAALVLALALAGPGAWSAPPQIRCSRPSRIRPSACLASTSACRRPVQL